MWQSDDDDLEEAFPLGDGTADTGAEAVCPCCGAPVALLLDPGEIGRASCRERV